MSEFEKIAGVGVVAAMGTWLTVYLTDLNRALIALGLVAAVLVGYLSGVGRKDDEEVF